MSKLTKDQKRKKIIEKKKRDRLTKICNENRNNKIADPMFLSPASEVIPVNKIKRGVSVSGEAWTGSTSKDFMHPWEPVGELCGIFKPVLDGTNEEFSDYQPDQWCVASGRIVGPFNSKDEAINYARDNLRMVIFRNDNGNMTDHLPDYNAIALNENEGVEAFQKTLDRIEYTYGSDFESELLFEAMEAIYKQRHPDISEISEEIDDYDEVVRTYKRQGLAREAERLTMVLEMW